MLSPVDLKKALSLYRRYKTTEMEYKAIARKYGMQTTDLNSLCWKVRKNPKAYAQ